MSTAKHIEKDPALERRFQPVFVGEPSVEDTIAILRGLKERYEVHHGIRITDNALVAAATLSHRYITDRFLPDKAIDLIDEAAARLRIAIDSLPQEIDEVERKIVQLEIERRRPGRPGPRPVRLGLPAGLHPPAGRRPGPAPPRHQPGPLGAGLAAGRGRREGAGDDDRLVRHPPPGAAGPRRRGGGRPLTQNLDSGP